MTLANFLTLATGTILTIAPQLIPAIPAPYAMLATAGLAFLTQLAHLFMTAPTTIAPKA